MERVIDIHKEGKRKEGDQKGDAVDLAVSFQQSLLFLLMVLHECKTFLGQPILL